MIAQNGRRLNDENPKVDPDTTMTDAFQDPAQMESELEHEDYGTTEELGVDTAEMRDGNTFMFMVVMLGLAAVAAFLIIYSFKLGNGTLAAPRSGLLLLVNGILIAVCLPFAWLLREKFEVFNPERVGYAGAMIGGLFAFVVLYWVGGFFVAAFISALIIARWSSAESWRNTLILAISLPVVCYLIFALGFKVSLNPIPGWL